MVRTNIDISDKDKKRHRWLIQRPERRHSVDLEELDKQDSKLYRYVLREARTLLPRPKFCSNYPDAKSVSTEYVGFILQHIVWQRLREQDEEDLECEKQESEIRRQSELPTDLTRKSRRVIPVDPIISPFDSGEDKDLVPKDTPQPSPVSTPRGTPIPSPKHLPSRPLQTQTPTASPETPSSPFTPKCPILHQESISS